MAYEMIDTAAQDDYQAFPEALTLEQRRVLLSIFAGRNIANAAELNGVHRGTVYRWMKSDPHFRARYNEWIESVAMGCRAQLSNMADRATQTIKTAVIEGNVPIAVQVLKGIGVFTPPTAPPPTDPALIARQDTIEKYKQRISMLERELSILNRRRWVSNTGSGACSILVMPRDNEDGVEMFRAIKGLGQPFTIHGPEKNPRAWIDCPNRQEHEKTLDQLRRLGYPGITHSSLKDDDTPPLLEQEIDKRDMSRDIDVVESLQLIDESAVKK